MKMLKAILVDSGFARWAPRNDEKGDWAPRNDEKGDWAPRNDEKGDWTPQNDQNYPARAINRIAILALAGLKRPIRALFSVFLLFSLLLLACSSPQPPLRVAIASSLLTPMNKVVTAFEAETGHKADLLPGSSGTLTAQIKNHAPFHVFISANQAYPQAIFESGLGREKPKTLVSGRLAFWTKIPISDASPSSFLRDNDALQKIAIANPKLAPFGEGAKRWLENKGIWDTIVPKLVYTENVSQVNHFIHSGAVDAAFTSVSSSLSEKLGEKGTWRELELAGSIPHDMIWLNQPHPQAKAFEEFLFSEKAAVIFKHYGYDIP